MPTPTEVLLRAIAPDLEAYVRPRLQGFLGAFLRAYLPQAWAFETEDGTTTVTIAADGQVTVAPEAVAAPDVTVAAPRARLEAVFARRGSPGPRPPDIRVAAHTAKGRAAVDQVRQRFGL